MAMWEMIFTLGIFPRNVKITSAGRKNDRFVFNSDPKTGKFDKMVRC